jgi:hypothetical protein
MHAGFATRELRHQGFPKHAGIAGGVVAWHPALIAEQYIDPIPGQVLLTKESIGRLRCLSAGQCYLGAIALGQHLIKL